VFTVGGTLHPAGGSGATGWQQDAKETLVGRGAREGLWYAMAQTVPG
jgi:hypothetical protein